MFSSIFYSFSLLFLDQGQEVLKPKKVIVEPRRSAMASDNQRRKSLQEPNLRKFIEYCGREIAGQGAIHSINYLKLFLFLQGLDIWAPVVPL